MEEISTIKLSVVIPLYNKELYVERAINSVLNAEGTNITEIIVVNDGSSDNGPALVQKLALENPAIKLITQKNMGVSSARNSGIRLASSDHILLLDADDEYLPEFPQTIARLIATYPNAGLFSTAFKHKLRNGKESIPKFVDVPDNLDGGIITNYLSACHKGAQPVWSSATAIAKTCFEAVGGFNTKLSHGEDKLFWLLASRNFDIAWSPKIGVIYHHQSEGQSVHSWKPEDGLKVYGEYLKIRDVAQASGETLNDIDLLLKRQLYTIVNNCLATHDASLARKLLWEHKTTFTIRQSIILLAKIIKNKISAGRIFQ